MPIPDALPARLWLLPHPPRERGEPTARPVLSAALGCDEPRLPLTRSTQGRPLLGPPFAAFDTGWSHSGEHLLLALGEAVQLGVDLERVRPRPRALELAQRFFHTQELDWLRSRSKEDLEPSFLRLWCAKEAVLKAHGNGLSFGLDKLVFSEDPAGLRLSHCDAALGRAEDWTLHEWIPLPGYRAALAWRAGKRKAGGGRG